MRIVKVPSLVLALALQALPITRVFIASSPATGSSFAIVFTWVAGAAALLGSYDAVSGASTKITSPINATGTNGTPFSYRITTGPDGANVFNAAPLPSGLTVSTTSGRITGTPTMDGTFIVLLTASDNNRADRTVTTNLTLTLLPNGGGVSNPPSITTQPANRTATNGGAATFTVTTTGTSPLRYQWSFGGTGLPNATNSTLTLMGLTTNQAGNYSVVVTNDFGSITSATAVLTVLVRSSIATQPASLGVMAGSNATFTVAANGTAPLRYQWRKNGSNLSGATNSSLTVTNAQPTHAGNYTVVVSNSVAAATSTVATLTVNLPDTTVPTLTVTSPSAAFTRVLSNSIILAGTAADNWGVAAVSARLGTNVPMTVTGTNDWAASFPLDPGTNIIRAWATDTSSNLSLTNTRTVFFAVMAPLSLSTNGSGAVASLTNNHLLELGKSYSLKATPAPGNLFSNWVVNGQAVTGPVLNFTMASNLTIVAKFVPNPFSGLKGAYSGLFHPAIPEPPHEQSGCFTLTVTDKGTYTGKLRINGGAFSIKGVFGLDLSARNTVLRTGTNELNVGLQLTAGSDRVIGYVSNALWVSELFGYRAAFHSTINPATNLLGKYTMLLSGSEDAAAAPMGLGSAAVTVARSGAVTLKGTLGDGTAGVQKGSLAANGQLPVYINLYRGKGSLFGWLNFTNTPTNDIPGLLLWTRKHGVPADYYPGGFTNEALSLASRYVPPLPGTAVLAFSNSVVILEGGNLAGPATNDVFLSSLNKVSVTSTNTSKLALTITSSSGLFSGSHVNPQTLKKSAIKGAVLQKQNLGGGSFLGANESGRVSFGLQEALPIFAP
jgi:hypothetical protein